MYVYLLSFLITSIHLSLPKALALPIPHNPTPNRNHHNRNSLIKFLERFPVSTQSSVNIKVATVAHTASRARVPGAWNWFAAAVTWATESGTGVSSAGMDGEVVMLESVSWV